MKRIILPVLMTFELSVSQAIDTEWYTQGNFEPQLRLEYTIENPLNIDRSDCPVTILRNEFPIPDIHEMWITLVDPQLPPAPEPTADILDRNGGHQLREEHNGHAIFHQLDDLDKDGIWDELFFQVDIQAKEKKTIYIYLGENIRGWNPHRTHANIGSYCRHLMPFWESENMGWKIWFANSVDVYGKRKPLLMSNRLYMGNLDGYGVAFENEDFGSDIQSVDFSFGGGAICLFEFAEEPEKVSIPRFTPVHEKLAPNSLWNAGQISDTRYAYEVVCNGPVRSMIKIKTMNWDTGNGCYEYDQHYTAYAGQSYCTSRVVYTKFFPKLPGVLMGCGIRKKPDEKFFLQKDGMLISSGPENIKDPENIDDRDLWRLPFIGAGLVVKNQYKPEYHFIEAFKGNHTYRITPDENHGYEYMLLNAWSEGAVYNNQETFTAYVEKCALEYNNPVKVNFIRSERKQKN